MENSLTRISLRVFKGHVCVYASKITVQYFPKGRLPVLQDVNWYFVENGFLQYWTKQSL